MIFKVKIITTREVMYTTEVVAQSFQEAHKISQSMSLKDFSTKEDRGEKIEAVHINKA